MRRILNRIERLHTLHLLSIAAILCSMLFLVSFWLPIVRIIESVRDIGTSFVFYVKKVFLHQESTTTITQPSNLDFFILFPFTWEEFCDSIKDYFPTFFSVKNFMSYIAILALELYNFSFLFMLLFPFLIMLFVLFRMSFTTKQEKQKKSKPLVLYLCLSVWMKDKVLRAFKILKVHFQNNRFYIYIFVAITLFYFNVVTLALEAIASYFYFVASFDAPFIFTMVYKIVFDLAIMLKGASLFVWLAVFAIVLNYVRKKLAVKKLRHNECKNKGFINSLPILNYCTSTTGAGKTLFNTDMALSNECIFHHDALDGLFKADLKFPNYPWYEFECAFTRAIDNHIVYNLATARDWVQETAGQEYEDGKDYFGYDIKRYPIIYNSGTKEETLLSVLSTYAQLFFVYITESTIIANYSIRSNCYKDNGFFPLWHEDFFSFNNEHTRFCHILDFDILRLGKKVLENNPKNGSLDFGVVLISEIDKERGNKFDLEQIDASSDETNQKNDLMNLDLRMRRHAATIDNKCYFRLFSEAQRDSDLGAGIREICYLTHIAEKDETELAMPFFLVEELIYQILRPILKRDYYNYRNNRIDRTLTMYLYKNIVGRFINHYDRTYMRYGYHRLTISKERGDGLGEPEEAYYYIAYGKAYDNRYSTDCFADFYAEQSRAAKVGINDYECYQGVRATMDELQNQHSYFIAKVTDIQNKNKGKDQYEEKARKFESNSNVPDWVFSQQKKSKSKRTR